MMNNCANNLDMTQKVPSTLPVRQIARSERPSIVVTMMTLCGRPGSMLVEGLEEDVVEADLEAAEAVVEV